MKMEEEDVNDKDKGGDVEGWDAEGEGEDEDDEDKGERGGGLPDLDLELESFLLHHLFSTLLLSCFDT